MNEADTERFNDAYRKFEAGSRSEALKGLHDLINSVHDPWEKTALLYHETLFLLEMDETKKGRECLDSFKAMLSSLGEPPTDGYQDKLPNNLAVMAGYTEMRVLLAEKKEAEALKRIEDLVSQYPKQLSISGFEQILGEIQTHRGFLLVNAGRYAEAKTILENSSPPEHWNGIVSSYLGTCYYQLRDFPSAKMKLSEALNRGIPKDQEPGVHYTLGVVEYHLSHMGAAKSEFEQYARTAAPDRLTETKIWEWLEETSRALGEYEEAEIYRKRREPPSSKVN